jgi:hypothetical protein
VKDYKHEKGVVSFAYSYVSKGVEMQGTFKGDIRTDLSIAGHWTEASTDGKHHFAGTARLAFVNQVDRLLLAGEWMMPGTTERWLVDLPIHTE